MLNFIASGFIFRDFKCKHFNNVFEIIKQTFEKRWTINLSYRSNTLQTTLSTISAILIIAREHFG